MKNALKKLLALGLSASMVIGCMATVQASEEPLELDVVVTIQEVDPDPTMAGGDENSTYMMHTWEGLTKIGMTDTLAGDGSNMYVGEVVLGQAESYEYDEATMTYTFTLRDDIFWTDGEPVKAQDFVYSWQRLVDPATASPVMNSLNGIVKNATEITNGEMEPSELGITAVDDKTLTIEMANPCSYFLEVLASKNLVPIRQDNVESGDKWMEPENIITNGPFYYSGWVHDGYIEVTKNENYYDADSITVDKITFHISGDETSILAAYNAGDYDYLGTVSADQIESLQASGDLFINPTIGMTYCYINTEKMTDWRVRAALMLAIDRENICENVRQDGSEPAIGLISSGFVNSEGTGWADYVGAPMYNWLAEQYPDADVESYIGRCELAQQLYAEAVADGWDESTTMTYWYNSNDVNKAIGEAIQSDITNVLGINMVLETCDSATYCDTISKGDYYLARLGQGGDYNDPFYYFTCFGTNGDWEFSGWSNAEWDEMFANVQTMEVGTERDELIKEMEQFMFTDQGFSVAPLYYSVKTYCAKSDLQNMMFYPINGRTFFGYVTRG